MNSSGGGTFLDIKNHIKSKLLNNVKICNEIESLRIITNNFNEALILAIFYKPHSTTNDLNEIIQEITKGIQHCKGKILIFSDFNLIAINWILEHPWNKQECNFLDSFYKNFLKQHTDVSTRDNTILDLVLRNYSSIIFNVTVGKHFAISDHYTLYIRFNIETNPKIIELKYLILIKCGIFLMKKKIKNTKLIHTSKEYKK